MLFRFNSKRQGESLLAGHVLGLKNPPFGLGFFAMMNFYDFDVFKDRRRSYTSRFRGRWFWMQPQGYEITSKFMEMIMIHRTAPVSGIIFMSWIWPMPTSWG